MNNINGMESSLAEFSPSIIVPEQISATNIDGLISSLGKTSIEINGDETKSENQESKYRIVSREPIWMRSTEQIAHWVDTLVRVSKLSKIINQDLARKKSPSTTIEKMDPWEFFHQTVPAENFPEDKASEMLEERISRFPRDLQTIYRTDFSDNRRDIPSRINRLVKDVFSAKCFSLIRSIHGRDGTLLLRHTRAGNENPREWIENAVIKWTTPLESASSDVFKFFLDDIYIPEGAALDFNKGVLIKNNGNEILSEKIDSAHLQNSFKLLRGNCSSDEAEHQCVMISERLNAANLADYVVNNHWRDLQLEQKQAIFRKVAKLAIADLIIGNHDRATMFAFRSTDLDEFHEANIGNIMIREETNKSKFPLVCAIDNGIQEENLVDGENYAEYNNGLSVLLRDSDWKKNISRAIINSFTKAFSMSSSFFEEINRNRDLVQISLDSFVADLQGQDTNQRSNEGQILRMHPEQRKQPSS